MTRDHDPKLESGEATEAEIDELAGHLRAHREPEPDADAFLRQADDIMASLTAAPSPDAAVEKRGGSWWSDFVDAVRERWHDMTAVQIGGWAVAALVLLVGVGYLATQLGSEDAPVETPDAPGVEVEVAATAPTPTAPTPDSIPDPQPPASDDTMVAEGDVDDEDESDDTDQGEVVSIDELETESLEVLAFDTDSFAPPTHDIDQLADALDDDEETLLAELDDDELSVLVASLDEDPFFNP